MVPPHPHSSTRGMAGASGEGEEAPESYWEDCSDVAFRNVCDDETYGFGALVKPGGGDLLATCIRAAKLKQEEMLAEWNEGNIDDGCIKYEDVGWSAPRAHIPLDHPVLLYINGRRSGSQQLTRKDCLEGADTVMAHGGETFVAMTKLRERLRVRDAGRKVKSAQKRGNDAEF